MHYSINGGCVGYGADVIIKDIHFEIKNNDHIALVGRNGCGKTTFLKLINGELLLEKPTDDENISISASENIVVGYLKQLSFDDYGITMQEEIEKAFSHLFAIRDEMNYLEHYLQGNTDDKAVQRYADLEEEYNLLEGYYYQKEFETVIKKLGFTQEDKSKKLSEFSGGQCTKIAFARLLLSKPDILLLDEPTNHLDITAVEWLEEYLKTYPKAVVIVSHDRMFLDKTCNTVYEIENKKIKKYSGNYSKFKAIKKANYAQQLKNYNLQQKKIKQLQETIERFRYKATKAAMAQSKIKQIEHMDIIEKPESFDENTFFSNLTPAVESGNDVLNVKNLEIGYNGHTLSTVNLFLQKQRKLGIIGDNGLGKSTFIKTIMGIVKPINGVFAFGANVQIGYFDQQMALYQSEKTIFDDYYDEFPFLTQTEIRNDLAAFVFRGEDVFKKISMLSGGEKVRFALCKMLKHRPNVLILDEPTNHMDILGKEALENILKNFSGTVICVSHDRYFINEICDCLLVFQKGQTFYYDYGYEQYKNSENNHITCDIPEKTKVQNKNNEKAKSYNIQKIIRKTSLKIRNLENEISDLENLIARLKNELNNPDNMSDYQKLTDIQEKIQHSENNLCELMDTWEENINILSELTGK